MARALFALLLAFSYPLQVVPFRGTFNRLVVPCEQRREKYGKHLYLLSTSLFLLITFAITMCQPDLADILGLIGAFTSSTVCYIIPSLYYYKLTENEPWTVLRILAVILGIFGCIVLLVCSSASIYKLFM